VDEIEEQCVINLTNIITRKTDEYINDMEEQDESIENEVE
jgi:hypothetical protein